MNEHKGAPENSEPRHETTDASIRNIVVFGVGLFLTIALSLWGVNGLFNYFVKRQALGPPASPFENTRKLPPANVPRLQVTPAKDMESYRKTEEEMLNSYGWVDQKSRTVRIPIERAMDLLIERGLPVEIGQPGQGELQPGTVEQYTGPKGYTPVR